MLKDNESYVIMYTNDGAEVVYSTFDSKDEMMRWLVNYQLENQDNPDVYVLSVLKGEVQFMHVKEETPYDY